MKNTSDIGFRIKKIREERNISQEELAVQLGISQSKLSKIENGHLNASLPLIIAASNLFNLSLADLTQVMQNIS